MARRSNRNSTATSNFGVGRRESHDSSPFYERFTPPETSDDDTIKVIDPETLADPFICADASRMEELPDCSIALIVTSPPYFVGKEYEEALGEGHVPATYLNYLDMLRRVFEECKRVLEPGGRIAVNVANLGRKPYRSLSADVIRILQDDLKLLLRGEVIWQKADGASGSCAWGSYRQATNPVLRDTTERIIIASKGRFDRAKSVRQRKKESLPHQSTINSDEFLEATLDVWRILPESASRVGHPSPFPVELPQRLIELYTFSGDWVLDPFMGAGSTLVAAVRTGRRYVGYDIEAKYVQIARERVNAERQACEAKARPNLRTELLDWEMPEAPPAPEDEGYQARATREGKAAQDIAEGILRDCGFEITAHNHKLRGLGVVVNFKAVDKKGHTWYFDVSGAFTTSRAGLLRTDTLWKALGRALVMTSDDHRRIVLLTTDLPRRGSTGDAALRAVGHDKIFDVIEMRSIEDKARLREYATGAYKKPLPGFWTNGASGTKHGGEAE